MKPAGLRSLLPVFLLFLLALALSAWIWQSSSGKASAVREKKEALALSRLSSQSRLMQSDAEKNLLLAHLAAYRKLEQRAATAGGNRLAWLEAVQEANRAAGLYGLQYTLEPAIAVPEVPELERTLMKLRLPLLTEIDLIRFLAALEARQTGLFRVQSCAMTLTGQLPPAVHNQPGLEAACELYWYNVRKAPTP